MAGESTSARILVVDDDDGMLHAVSRVLGKRYRVFTQSSPLEALEQAVSIRPNVAVVDIRMPEKNGFELTRELQEKLPDLDVILMTGNAEEPDANLIRAIDEGAFYFIQKPFDRRVLLTLVSRCLELRRLREEKQRHLQQLEDELEEARLFQLSLLPPQAKTFLGVSVSARYVACNQLAGDIYDYAAAEDGTVALMIADVVGHGASAAMMTALVKSAFRSAQVDGYQPLSVIDRVKEGLRVFDASRFVTLACARLNPATRELTYVNAGHPSPIVLRPHQEPLFLSSTGPLISSALYDLPFRQATATLSNGDSLLFYTDGVTEAHGPQGMFGQERMVSLIQDNGCTGSELLERLLSAVTQFSESRPIRDDMTLLSVEYAAD